MQFKRDCVECERTFYTQWAEDRLCPICDDDERHWCVTCGEEAEREHVGNHYCAQCYVDAAQTCFKCGKESGELEPDGNKTWDDEQWMICPECKEL